MLPADVLPGAAGFGRLHVPLNNWSRRPLLGRLLGVNSHRWRWRCKPQPKKQLPVIPQLICTSLQARTVCKMQRRPSMASPEVRASSFQLCRVCAAFSRCPSASVFSPVDLRQEEPANTALVHKLRASVLKTECRSGTMSICFQMNQRSTDHEKC